MENTNASLNTQGNEGGEGNVATLPTFAEQLDGSLKTDARLAQWKETGLSGLVNDYFKLGEDHQSLKGKIEGTIKVPGENATEAEVLAYKQAIGVPEKSEDYKLEKPQLPEGMPYDEKLIETFKNTAIQLNMTPQQVQGIYKMFLDYDMNIHNEVNKHIVANREKAVNTLKDIWKGDTYQENREKTTRSFLKFLEVSNPPEAFGGAEGVKGWFDQNGLGDDPVVVWFFSKVFEQISDDKFVSGISGSGVTREPGMLDFSKSMPK